MSDHALLSTGGAILLSPWLRRAVVVPWAASILIDVDHYLWFCASERSLNPVRAVRYFGRAQPPQHSGTRLLHHPAVLLSLLALSRRSRWVGLLLLGMAFHVGLDTYHGVRMDGARRAALRRDRGTCQQCGAQGADVVTHLVYQPRVLPSYRPEYLISLCGECHERAHARGVQPARHPNVIVQDPASRGSGRGDA